MYSFRAFAVADSFSKSVILANVGRFSCLLWSSRERAGPFGVLVHPTWITRKEGVPRASSLAFYVLRCAKRPKLGKMSET
jgi:hypothetical protein